MGDPINDLARAAETYIDATGDGSENAGVAFEKTLMMFSSALEQGALTDADRDRLIGEWSDFKTASGAASAEPGAEDLFRLRQEQRDFADTTAYLATGDGEGTTAPLRIATPIPVPEDAPHLEHVMVDTGRYTLRVNKDETVRAFDKATGAVWVLTADEGLHLRPSSNPGSKYIVLQDETYVRFDGDQIAISKNAPPEDESAPMISFPIVQERPEGDRVLILDYPVSGVSEDGGAKTENPGRRQR